MSVVQVQPSSEFEPGTVLEVNRSGYALNGQVKATAQVTVARAE
jgi:molecular chaperone GrpE (heat shock protein)